MDQPTQHDGGEAGGDQAQAASYCVFHPEVETGLSCSRCDRPICVRCMVQAPVGIRCRDCANVQRLPTFDVGPSFYVRASLVGGAVAVVSGFAWGLLVHLFPSAPMAGFLALAVGYAVGESISVATNRKRGNGLMMLAGSYVVLSLLSASIIDSSIFGLLFRSYSFIPLLMLLLGGYIAVRRVR